MPSLKKFERLIELSLLNICLIWWQMDTDQPLKQDEFIINREKKEGMYNFVSFPSLDPKIMNSKPQISKKMLTCCKHNFQQKQIFCIRSLQIEQVCFANLVSKFSIFTSLSFCRLVWLVTRTRTRVTFLVTLIRTQSWLTMTRTRTRPFRLGLGTRTRCLWLGLDGKILNIHYLQNSVLNSVNSFAKCVFQKLITNHVPKLHRITSQE